MLTYKNLTGSDAPSSIKEIQRSLKTKEAAGGDAPHPDLNPQKSKKLKVGVLRAVTVVKPKTRPPATTDDTAPPPAGALGLRPHTRVA
jgi:hypothetical protein